jgi:hypothetical protein
MLAFFAIFNCQGAVNIIIISFAAFCANMPQLYLEKLAASKVSGIHFKTSSLGVGAFGGKKLSLPCTHPP